MNPVGNTGHSAPLGATVVDGGVNFSLYSRSATGVELLLSPPALPRRPSRGRPPRASQRLYPTACGGACPAPATGARCHAAGRAGGWPRRAGGAARAAASGCACPAPARSPMGAAAPHARARKHSRRDAATSGCRGMRPGDTLPRHLDKKEPLEFLSAPRCKVSGLAETRPSNNIHHFHPSFAHVSQQLLRPELLLT